MRDDSMWDLTVGFLLGLMAMLIVMVFTEPSTANQMHCHEDEALVWVQLMPDSNKSTTRCVPIDDLTVEWKEGVAE